MGRRGASGGGHGQVQVGRGVDGLEAVIAGRALPVRAAIVAALLLSIVGLGSAGAGGPTSGQHDQAVGDACRTVFQTPAHPGDPVITQVILVATGEVVAARTGDGPFEPADYAERCNGAVQQPNAPPVAPPAAPISDSPS